MDPGSPFADGSGLVAGANVDIAQELVKTMVAQVSCSANLAVIKSEQQQGYLLNIFA